MLPFSCGFGGHRDVNAEDECIIFFLRGSSGESKAAARQQGAQNLLSLDLLLL